MKQNINRRDFIKVMGLSAAAAAYAGSGCFKGENSSSKPNRKPNVILIISDDMGFADGMGNTEISIPNLKRLADDGVSFTNAYVTAPICLPSRIAMMSGCYHQRFGIYDNVYGVDKNRLFFEHTLLPRVFQRAGYRTGLVGKWHLSGNIPGDYHPGIPLERGFDEFVGILQGMTTYSPGTTLYRGTTAFKAPKYLTDFFGDEACQFLELNKEGPFFLTLAFNAVHAPMQALEEDKVKLSGTTSKGPMRETYGGMMTALDRNVGRVLDKVDALGLKDDTIVLFINDNGGFGCTDPSSPPHSMNYADNSPLRGYKFDLYEGGIRVPFYMRWPGHIKKGSTYDEMVSSMDIFPTVVKAAGLKRPEQACDGRDLMSYLNDPSKEGPHPWLCWQNRVWAPYGEHEYIRPRYHIHNCAVRKDNWKLVRYNEKIDSTDAALPWQLYDLSEDASEKNDVSARHPEVVKELDDIFTKWRTSMHPSMEDGES